MTHHEEGTGRRRAAGVALAVLLASLVLLSWLDRERPAPPGPAPVREAVGAYLHALQAGDRAEARRWLTFPLAGHEGWPVAGARIHVVSGFSMGSPRVDLAGRVHVPVSLSLSRRDDPSAIRLLMDLIGLNTPAGPRLVASHRQVAGWLFARDDRLWWQEPRGAPQARLALADLPAEATPVGAPAGVTVATSREAFGPTALLSGGQLLVTTTGDRPLVLLARGETAAGPHPAGEAPAGQPSSRPVVLDVLRRAAPQLWQVDEDHGHAALAVITEGGAHTFVVYGLTHPYRAFSPSRQMFPPAAYHLVPAGWHQGDLLFDARPRRARSSLLDRSVAGAGRWRFQVPSGRVTRWAAPAAEAASLP